MRTAVGARLDRYLFFIRPSVVMTKAFVLTLIAVAFVALLAVVTPWLVNRDSTLTLLAVPFVWLAFAAGAWRLLRMVLARPLRGTGG